MVQESKEASLQDIHGGNKNERKTGAHVKQETKTSPLPKRLWDKLELNMGMLMIMSKYVQSVYV